MQVDGFLLIDDGEENGTMILYGDMDKILSPIEVDTKFVNEVERK